jgi:dienelactone hydrolase
MKRVILALSMLLSISVYSQENSKKPLTHDVYNDWKSISNPIISNNGQWISYEVNPNKGDGTLWVVNNSNSKEFQFPRGYDASFSPNSNFIIYKIKPKYQDIRKSKLDKKKKDEMPKDSCGILVFQNQRSFIYKNLQSYKLPDENGDFVLIATEMQKKKTKVDSSATKKRKPKKSNNKKSSKLSTLHIFNPINEKTFTTDSISEYNISKNGRLASFSKVFGDTVKQVSLYVFDTEAFDKKMIFSSRGEIAKIALDSKGKQVAFVFTGDTGKVKTYELYYWNAKLDSPVLIASKKSESIRQGWMVSQNFTPYFSENGNRIFFGTTQIPEEEPRDTLTDDEKVVLDVWSWTDTLLQTQQKVNLKEEQNKSSLAVYHIDKKKVVQLANDSIPIKGIPNKGNSDYILVACDKPYQYSMTWESPQKSDFYLLNVNTGEFELILKGLPFTPSLSPSGKYLAYYNPKDSSWYTMNTKSKVTISQTKSLPVNFFDESNDIPRIPYHYGFAGWVNKDKYFLVYDKYDIWALDPTGKEKPICITNGKGRKSKISYRIIRTNDDDYLGSKGDELVSIFDNTTKKSGYGFINLNDKKGVRINILTDHLYRFIAKSKDSDKVIWRRESYQEYRDVWCSDINFDKVVKLSEANPQMSSYKWGTVELVKWIDFNRDSVEGLLYLPEDFDPSKKYPMMVYFYETYTDNLHRHFAPSPSRSVINPTMYVSNGYVVFIPDIKYQIGYPGHSAYDAVISGTMAMLSKGFVDKDRIGVQGQSWGGYQVAYLVTRTNLFRAASAGAPVSNMTSAYGGIRWGSGLARMFQYEHTQSRIGGTLWDKPLLYIENSPLFHAPRVQTPLLIRHDDADEAVPWYQGIELFLALRRLGKPVWMINYNDDAHNLKQWANRVDWSIRMQQFFDYYLKDAPMPKWMNGIPQSKKGKTMGYEPVNK